MISEILQPRKVIPPCHGHPEPGLNLKTHQTEKSKNFNISLCSLSKKDNTYIFFDKKVKISSLPNNEHPKPDLRLLLLSLLPLLRTGDILYFMVWKVSKPCAILLSSPSMKSMLLKVVVDQGSAGFLPTLLKYTQYT